MLFVKQELLKILENKAINRVEEYKIKLNTMIGFFLIQQRIQEEYPQIDTISSFWRMALETLEKDMAVEPCLFFYPKPIVEGV